MKKIFTLLFLLASFFSYSQSTTVVISQIYGGGGGAQATFNSDYVELHNISAIAQNISGFKLAYGSSSGLLGSTTGNRYTFPSNTIIPAGGYLLVADSGLTGGLANLPVTKDLYFSFAMSATKGKIVLGTSALVDSVLLADQPAGAVVDFIGYGTATEYEGSTAAGGTTNTSAALRNNNGCDDTNQNSADFTIGTPNPRNSATPVFICGSATNPVLGATSLAPFGNVCITNPTPAPGSFSISGSNLTAGNITIGPLTGYTFSTASAGPFSATVTVSQTGTLASTTIYVNFTPTAAQSYNGNIAVSGGGANAVNVIASGAGVSNTIVTTGAATGVSTTGANISGSLTQGCAAPTSYGIEYSTTSGFTPGTGTAVVSTNLSGTSFSSALIGLTPNTTYYYVAYAITPAGNVYGTASTFTTPPQSASTAEVVISQIYGGGGSGPSGGAQPTFKADYVELHNTAATSQDISGFKLLYGSRAGVLGSLASNRFSFPAGTIIPAGGYLLVANNPADTMVGAQLPVAADHFFSFNLSKNNGKVALGNSSMLDSVDLAGQPAGAVIDFVGYGTALEFETAAAAGLDSLTAAYRNNNGCDDTDNNQADFTNATPLPRNSTSPVYICGSTTNPTLTAGILTAFENVCLNTTASGSFVISGSNLTAGDITVGPLAGYSFSTSSAGPFSATATVAQTGTLASTTIYVNFTPTAVQSYDGNIAISGGGADVINVAASGSGAGTTSVATAVASSITSSSAVVAGTLTAGCTTVTSYGIEYSTTSGFTPGTGTQIASTNLSGSTYTAALAGLAATTTYYYVAYAVTASDTLYGSQSSFTTTAIVTTPVLSATTLAPFGDVCVNATASGSFAISGSNLTAGDITVGPLDGYSFSTSLAGPYTATISVPQTGTLSSTTIYVNFTPTAVQSYDGNIAISGGGADVINVAASGSGAGTTSVATAVATSITSSSAVVAGTLTAGCTTVTSYGIEYSTTSGFTPGTGTQAGSTNLSGTSYTAALSGLAATTTYYYVAYAITATDTLNGTESSFTTTSVVTTPSLTATTLTAFGDVCVNSTSTANSFEISGADLTAGDITVGPLDGFAFSSTATGTYTSTLTITQTGGVLATTSVYVQLTPTAAQTYDGNISISGGGATASVAASGSGTTSSLAVATLDSSSITSNSAVLHGSVVSGACGGAVTEWGIEYSSVQNFPTGNATKIASSGAQSGYSVTVAGLVQNTTYYYRAYANNGGNYVYGEQKLFFTGTINTGLTVNPNPVQRGGAFNITLSGIKAGQDYGIRLFNSAGQLVFEQFVNAQVNFISKSINLPSNLTPGLHVLQVASPDFRIEKPVMVQ